MEIKDNGRAKEDRRTGEAYEISHTSGIEFLREWKEHNPEEYEADLAEERNPDRANEETVLREWMYKLPVTKSENLSTSLPHVQAGERQDQVPVSEIPKSPNNTDSIPLR